MRKIVVGFLVGTVFVIVGLLLALQAGSLATEWSYSGNVGRGILDEARAHVYRTTGLLVLGFGLVVNAVAFCRWLWQSPDQRQ
jgi:hypothetical protein